MNSVSFSPALSENYSDIIALNSSLPDNFPEKLSELYSQQVNSQYTILYAPLSENLSTAEEIGYSSVPKLFTEINVVSLEASGILPVRIRSSLELSGSGILLGFLDSGIDYTHPVFRNTDGSSRILRLWDQSDKRGTPPSGISYGSEFTKEQIDEALFSVISSEIIPNRDPSGHGTAVAGIACGSPEAGQGFTGAAPSCGIAFVRLKPAKNYLRDYFRIPDDAVAYQENDLMLGIRYLLNCSEQLAMPLVICLSLGTNQGGHTGETPLEKVLDAAAESPGICTVTGTGNEAGFDHHFLGRLRHHNDTADIELLVDQETPGFSVEFWADISDLCALGFTSPLGETFQPFLPDSGSSRTLSFLLEKSSISLTCSILPFPDDSQLILMRFTDPTPGIWRIHVVSLSFVTGVFHLWLPISGLVERNIRFSAASADTTLVIPSCASSSITVSSWNAYNNSLYAHSGRGYTRNGQIKPDFASPGVQVTCPAPGGGYSSLTGSCAASALAAGASALLLESGLRQEPPRHFTFTELKKLFRDGTQKQTSYSYPDREWGYGSMNVYESFLSHMAGKNI
ncbi:MAG: S8 family peptidase [Lachnospiraceae bacterium]|nr:S8 family peptidase [Lachnospiraceae bacterium]